MLIRIERVILFRGMKKISIYTIFNQPGTQLRGRNVPLKCGIYRCIINYIKIYTYDQFAFSITFCFLNILY